MTVCSVNTLGLGSANDSMEGEDRQDLFQYRPLLGQGSIRLLNLMPGQGNYEITSDMVNAEVTSGARSRTHYEALSYTWGDPTEKREMRCCGLSLQITSSLYNALKQLRYPDRTRTLWVDAVCINQGDIEERSSQVSLMQLIYTQTDRVIIWLGQNDSLTADAIAALERVYQSIKASSHTQSGLPNQGLSASSVHLDLSRLETVAIARLFQRPWFKRVWVVQEAVSATCVVVVCGTCSIDWEHLATVCMMDEFLLLSGVSAAMIRASVGILAIRRMQKLRNFDGGLALLSLLVSIRGLDATDPRDKLFAIQHLASEKAARVAINYKSSTASVYTQYAVEYLKSTSLDILSAVNPSGIVPPSNTSYLPSWVPDWSLKPNFTNYPGEHLPLIMSANHFRASGSSAPIYTVSSSSDLMIVRGAKIDSLHALGSPGWKGSRWEESFATLRYEFEEAPNTDSESPLPIDDMQKYLMLNSNSIYRSNTSKTSEIDLDRYRVLLEVLVCDTDPHGNRLYPRRLKPPLAFLNTILPNSASHPCLPFFMQQPFFPSPLLQRIRDMAWGRRFCVTSEGHVGWVPQNAQVGDIVCYFLGGKVLYLLRPDTQDRFVFIGECYLHGLMHGEALKLSGLSLQDFNIK